MEFDAAATITKFTNASRKEISELPPATLFNWKDYVQSKTDNILEKLSPNTRDDLCYPNEFVSQCFFGAMNLIGSVIGIRLKHESGASYENVADIIRQYKSKLTLNLIELEVIETLQERGYEKMSKSDRRRKEYFIKGGGHVRRIGIQPSKANLLHLNERTAVEAPFGQKILKPSEIALRLYYLVSFARKLWKYSITNKDAIAYFDSMRLLLWIDLSTKFLWGTDDECIETLEKNKSNKSADIAPYFISHNILPHHKPIT